MVIPLLLVLSVGVIE